MSESPDERLAQLCIAIGVNVPRDFLELSMTHRSYAYENGGLPTNERLEFLGDAVLSLHVTETLYRRFSHYPEGRLAKLRASVVNMRALATIARGLGPGGLGACLKLGRGEIVTGGTDKDSILADGFEALLGAVHLGVGPDAAGRMVTRLLDPMIDLAISGSAGLDWKTHLQELTAELGLGVPGYHLTHSGPDHAKEFTAIVVLNGNEHGSGIGRTKKEAEQIAAEITSKALIPHHD